MILKTYLLCFWISLAMSQISEIDKLIDDVLNKNDTPKIQHINGTVKQWTNDNNLKPTEIEKLIHNVLNENGTSNGIVKQWTNNSILNFTKVFNETGEDCICFPYYFCNDENISTDSKISIDPRIFRQCEYYLDICCTLPIYISINPSPYEGDGCGQRHPDGVSIRILGGNSQEAMFGEFPWMIILLMRRVLTNGTEMVYQCGGALIHESLVLTAAHCIKKEQQNASELDLYVRAGEWDFPRTNEILGHQNRKVGRIIIHPGFQSGNAWNDFALLLLERPMAIGKNVRTVCLPAPGVIPQSKECWVSGWGKDRFGHNGKYQNILKKIDLPIVPRNKCIDLLQKTRLTKYFRLHESFLCAGGVVGKDTCQGDGGSPLVCPIDGKPGTYEVSGLVSWGIGCGTETPGVYADVSYAREWIDKTMAELDLSIN